MRILRIITRLNIGGPAIHVTSLAKEFNNEQDQTLLVFGKTGFYEGNMYHLLEGLEKLTQYYYLPYLQREIQWEMDLRAFITLFKVIGKFRPDVIHTHTSKAGTLGRLVGMLWNFIYWFTRRHRKIKFVHTYHGHTFHDYWSGKKTRWLLTLERFLNVFTDKVIVISKQQKKEICGMFKVAGKHKTVVIPLGLDLSEFRNTSTSNEIANIGIVGRLTSIKNHKMFIDMIKYLVSQTRFFNFYVIGDGEDRYYLRQYAKVLGVDDFVKFMDWIPSPQMSSIYNNLDIVVQTSLNEGTPVALIEAMTCGKPVVSTDVGGVYDMGMKHLYDVLYKGNEATGIVVGVGQTELLGKAILWLRDNPDKAKEMGQRAREFVLKNYNLERLIRDLKMLYDSL